MRKKIDILIGSVCFISFIVALKLSSLPPVHFMPDFIVRLFLSSEEMRSQYAFLYDVAIAFLISGLFYFMVDSIPDRIKEDRAKRIIGKYVGEVESAMLFIIETIRFIYDISESIAGLGTKDFYILDSDTKQSEREIAYHSIRHENKKTIKSMGYGSLNSIVRSRIKAILSYVANIKQYEYLYAGNTGFMECMRNIELCSFVSYFNEQKGYECFLFDDSSIMIGELVDLYRELKSYKMSNFHMDFEFCSEEETESYRKERQTLKGIKIVSKRREEYAKLAYKNRTAIVLFDHHNTNNSIVTYLRDHLQMENVNPEVSGKIENINEYKVVVILTTRISKKLLDRIKIYREIQKYEGKLLIIYRYKDFSTLFLKRNKYLAVDYYWIKSCIKFPILNTFFWREEPTKETLNPLINTICKLQGAEAKMII